MPPEDSMSFHFRWSDSPWFYRVSKFPPSSLFMLTYSTLGFGDLKLFLGTLKKHKMWLCSYSGFVNSLAFPFQRRAVAAVRCGSRACRPRSCCRPPTLPPLLCETLRGVAMTASWESTPSLMTNSSPTNTHSTINRRLSTSSHPWITSMHVPVLHSITVTSQAVCCHVFYVNFRRTKQKMSHFTKCAKSFVRSLEVDQFLFDKMKYAKTLMES